MTKVRNGPKCASTGLARDAFAGVRHSPAFSRRAQRARARGPRRSATWRTWVVKAGGTVLRYGSLYGPGATDGWVELVRKRQFPLVERGTGYLSWVHLDDAASATVLGPGAASERRVQHRRRRTSPGQPVAALSGRVRGGETAGAGPQVGGPAAGRGHGGDHDDRGAWLRQRQGQAGSRLETALPLMAAGLQKRACVSRAEEFQQLRPLLFSIANRVLGSVAEAEDAVQETWLRYAASPTQPTSAKAFLSAVVTRISIDVLRSARVRREEYAGPWFPSRCTIESHPISLSPTRASEAALCET